MMLQVRYLLPFAFLALLPVGGLLGGAWTFLAAIATPLCLILLDRALGDELRPEGLGKGRVARWVPRIYILLQLSATAWAATRIASGARPIEILGLGASTGLTAGVFGFLAAHEMIHSREGREQALGMLFLASVFYMHFRTAHLFGHHRHAATIHDPTSAPLGESLYAFLPRSIWGQLRVAWAHECSHLRQSGRSRFSIRNQMISSFAIEILIIVGIALVSVTALIFLLGVAAVAITLLETFNYVAHYGLRRRPQANGRMEALQPRHSWNSRRWMNNAALFNMGWHSDHHQYPYRSFERLEPIPGEADLPYGYAAAVVMAFIPPLWGHVMDSRARGALIG